jgi:hypothetical protein
MSAIIASEIVFRFTTTAGAAGDTTANTTVSTFLGKYADTTAASAKGSATAQLLTIASNTTAPAGVTFSSPTTAGSGVALGTIPVANVKGLWVRRSAANTSALSGDGVTLAVQVDTGSL